MHFLRVPLFIAVLFSSLVLTPGLRAGNDVLGEIELEGASKVEQTSGVWVDKQYVGYLEELKGDKKILLLPGEHEITVRQGGYVDFVQRIAVRAGEKQVVRVKMQRDPREQMPQVTAEVKLDVTPNRAAVFVDGMFMGHAAEFNGIGRALLVAPGKRRIVITLPGYQNFETELNLAANQKSTIKTVLARGATTGVETPITEER